MALNENVEYKLLDRMHQAPRPCCKPRVFVNNSPHIIGNGRLNDHDCYARYLVRIGMFERASVIEAIDSPSAGVRWPVVTLVTLVLRAWRVRLRDGDGDRLNAKEANRDLP